MQTWFRSLSTIQKALYFGGISVALLLALAVAFITMNSSPSSENQTNSAVSSTNKSNTTSATHPKSPSPTGTPVTTVPSPTNSESPSSAAQAPLAPEIPAESGPAVSVPGTPTAIYAFAGASAPGQAYVGFRFEPPTSDGGSGITSYTGSCSLDGGATWTYFALGSSAAGDHSMTCVQSGMDGSIEPIFQVSAENAVGRGSWVRF